MADALEKTLPDKAAVLAEMPDHPAVKAILAWNADALVDARFDRLELTLSIVPEAIRAAAATVQAAGYNFFEDMTAVDWFPSTPRFQLSYHILSHSFKERIRLERTRRSIPSPPSGNQPDITNAKCLTCSASVSKAIPICAAS
jgi:NADH-quinone oxidoreductase subunit C